MMNRSTRVVSRRRRTWPSAPPTTAALIATAALTLLAACSGSPQSTGPGSSPNAGGSANAPPAVGYSACMRSHGVPDYPDPDSSGQLPKTDAHLLGVSSSQYQDARQTCRHRLPTGGSLQQQETQCMENSDCTPALGQQILTADRKLAQCMRSHGVPDFPDPTNDGSGGPFSNISKVGISDATSHAPWFETKLDECGRLVVGDNAPESFG
jgi:hypothetical protein